jgi:uncharacterized DUF497 family protein
MASDKDEPHGIEGFDWNPAKRELILRERGIDFVDAARVLSGPVYEHRSDREGEQRFVAIGPLTEGILIAVVYTIRGNKIRIITARAARRGEKHAYLHARKIAPDEGTD